MVTNVITFHAGFGFLLGMGVIDPDFFWNVFNVGNALDEAFGMQGIEGLERSCPRLNDFRMGVEVNAFRGEHGDPGMPVFGIVPGEELPAESAGVFERAEAFRIAGTVFECFEGRLGDDWSRITF